MREYHVLITYDGILVPSGWFVNPNASRFALVATLNASHLLPFQNGVLPLASLLEVGASTFSKEDFTKPD